MQPQAAQLSGQPNRMWHCLPTLCQLEDVLLAVKDAQGAARRNLTNVSTVEPAILVQHLQRGRSALTDSGSAVHFDWGHHNIVGKCGHLSD